MVLSLVSHVLDNPRMVEVFRSNRRRMRSERLIAIDIVAIPFSEHSLLHSNGSVLGSLAILT